MLLSSENEKPDTGESAEEAKREGFENELLQAVKAFFHHELFTSAFSEPIKSPSQEPKLPVCRPTH
ncbi:hypothetical protein CVT26_010952 [Gymnopilus dilepis]|uniref:Uncharacterized protein n=1 Tax=Gymnopilus dilepis TaxID=231916 RepID=A0A409VJ14_9AGAR|nr:hypothetical protein CVT26_010952 [Gymnopilus dilepis]